MVTVYNKVFNGACVTVVGSSSGHTSHNHDPWTNPVLCQAGHSPDSVLKVSGGPEAPQGAGDKC